MNWEKWILLALEAVAILSVVGTIGKVNRSPRVWLSRS